MFRNICKQAGENLVIVPSGYFYFLSEIRGYLQRGGGEKGSGDLRRRCETVSSARSVTKEMQWNWWAVLSIHLEHIFKVRSVCIPFFLLHSVQLLPCRRRADVELGLQSSYFSRRYHCMDEEGDSRAEGLFKIQGKGRDENMGE